MGMTNQNDKNISELKIVTYQVNLSQMLEYISTKFFQVLPKYLGTYALCSSNSILIVPNM